MTDTIESEPNRNEMADRLARAQQLLRAGTVAEAGAELERAVKDDPAAAQAHMLLAIALKAGGRLDRAEHHLLCALAIEPGRWPNHRTLAALRLDRRRFAEALAALDAAVALAPDEIELRRLRATALHLLHREAEAEAELRRLVVRHPADAESHYNLGLYLNRHGRLPEAEACFRRASRLKPGWPAPHQALGVVFLRAGLHGKASDYLRRSYRLAHAEPNDSGPPVLRDAPLAEGIAGDGLEAIPLAVAGGVSDALMVRFPRAIVERGLAMPIAPSGRFFSREFSAMQYPEKYDFLWSAATRAAVIERLAGADDFSDGFLVCGFAGNYGNWLLDCLPTFLALKALDPRRRITLIADEFPRFRSDSLERFRRRHGLREIDVVVTSQPFYAVRDAFIVSRMDRAEQTSAIAALRLDRAPHRRLFVGRSGTNMRRLVNEGAVYEALASLGFERVDPFLLSFADQLALFSEARIVVGIQGAALANCLFCAPGTPIVALYAGRFMPFYREFMSHIPLPVTEIAGEIRDDRPNWLPEHCDFTVSVADVVAAVNRALAGSPRA
jgi:Tfp pilus assembly protein PilF